MIHPTREGIRRLWARPWVRRLTYLLAGGATVIQVGSWGLERPATHRWISRRLDALVREETGLPFVMGRIESNLWSGHLVLHDLAWGGDLVTVRRVELRFHPRSLLGRSPRFFLVRLEDPVARPTEARLRDLKLKARPKSTTEPPQVLVDLLQVSGGRVEVDGPAWGLPRLTLPFEVTGQGLGPNRVRLALSSPALRVVGPRGPERGELQLDADLSEQVLSLLRGHLKLDRTQARLQGRYEVLSQRSDLRLRVNADLAQLTAWAGQVPRLGGEARITAELAGTVNRPRWTFQAEVPALDPGRGPLVPGALSLRARGTERQARLEALSWVSPQGELTARGEWTKGAAPWAQVEAPRVAGDLLGRLGRLPGLGSTQVHLRGRVEGPAALEALTRPDRYRLDLAGGATDPQGGAGTFEGKLEGGRATFSAGALRLGDLTLTASGQARVGGRGLESLLAEGEVETRVGQVAEVLRRWDIVDLPMDGQVRAKGSVSLGGPGGLTVDGHLAVDRPRWEREEAEDLEADVRIRKDQLWVEGTRVHAGGGEVTGNLWLTWDPRAPGDQLDLCYAASRVAASHGLRAAGLTDQDLGVKLEGTGHGWVRIHGPFKALRLEGQMLAEKASLEVLPEPGEAPPFRMEVPAASARLEMDLTPLRLRLRDLRIAGDVGGLESGAAEPSGPLALQGDLDMDLAHGTWWGHLAGRLDTGPFEMGIPRVVGRADFTLEGPYVRDFGPWPLPLGRFRLSGGRVLLGDRSLEDLEARVDLRPGALRATLGRAGSALPLVALKADEQAGRVTGGLELRVLPEGGEADPLIPRLTRDFVEDARLSLDATGTWAPQEGLRWQGTLTRLEGTFPAFTLRQSRPSRLSGTGEGAQVDLFLEGLQRRRLSPEGQLRPSASVSLAGTLPFSATAPLALRAKGAMDLGDLKTIADGLLDVDDGSLLHSLRPEGRGDFDLLAHGSYGDPKVQGTLDVEGASLRLGDYENIRDLGLHVRFQDRTIAIPAERPLTGTLNQGRLTAQGEVVWKPGGLDRYELNARLAGFQLQDPPELQGLIMQGDLEASLKGDEEGGLLKGTLDTGRLAYQADLKLYDLLVNSALADSASFSSKDPNDPLDRIRLDLEVRMARPWELDTNLAKLEGKPDGAFRVMGTLANPGLKGRMALEPGGRITNLLPAGDVVLNRGSFDFTDPDQQAFNPHLDLAGEVQVPGYTVNVGITGTLATLNWQLSSIPRLSQSDIVAVLINPEYASSAGTAPGGSQGAVNSGLASASTGLLTTLALAAFQEQVRKTFGLDRVSFSVRTGSTGSTETDVVLGKRVNLFGWRVPLIWSQRRTRDLTTTSGQMEWRFGGFTLQLGATQAPNTGVNPSGEIRHTWSPKN